jgi:hypothetical protein
VVVTPDETTHAESVGGGDVGRAYGLREVELEGGGLETQHGMLLSVVGFFSASHI